MQHPFLYFSGNDVEKFKVKINSDKDAKSRYYKTVADSERLLNEDFVTEAFANGKKSLHGSFWDLSRQTNEMVTALGTKYLIEGDLRCAEKLKALLKHFTAYERWYSESYINRIPIPWHSDLCSTRMTLAVATVYDIIYYFLNADEQKYYAEKIFELGVMPALEDWALPETRIHALDSMGHNWWSVCVGEAATGLLTIAEHLPADERKRLFDCANESLAGFFTYNGNALYNKLRNFDDDGLFYESIGYFEYGVGTPLRYLWCYERYFGENKVLRDAINPGMGDAFMHFSYPYRRDGKTAYAFLNFGDSRFWDEHSTITKYLDRNGLSTSAVRACNSTYEVDLWDEIGGYSTNAPSASTDALPTVKFFSSGYAVSRSSWEPNGTLLAIKSGYCWNHSHNDSGTFTIIHKGRPLIVDCGTCSYDDPLYHAYYCQDLAHNVLRVGGKGRRDEELYRGTKFIGGIIDKKVGTDYLFVQTDCTGPMAHLCSRMYRNYFWINNRILVIFDDVYCHAEDTIDFSLHYAGECRQSDKGFEIVDGDSHARLISHLPKSMSCSMKIGHIEQKPDENEPYLELSTTEKKRTHLLIHTLELDVDESTVEYKRLHGENSDGLSVKDGEITYELWYNRMADGHVMHDNSNNIIAGYDTDAYMLLITRNKADDTEKVLTICGSYLRKGRDVYLSSFEKTTRELVTKI